MSRNLYNLRFGVKSSDGYVSSLWRLWVTRHGDVYLSVKSHAGVTKYSFHKSGICRSAFTKEHGVPEALSDRAMFKWRRKQTPIQGVNEASRVAWIAFPTDFLSRDVSKERKKVTWIGSAPSSGATHVELAYTAETEQSVRKSFRAQGSRNLVRYVPLSAEEALIVVYYYSLWENKDLTSPASKDSIFPDLVFSANDHENTGRPVRIIFGKQPSDGDALILQELGGYKTGSG